MSSTILFTVLALTAAPQAQNPSWYAFEGCWRATPQQEGAPLVCMRESGGSLLMSTYVSGELKSEQRITADGAAHPISEGGCSGEETGSWSADGGRVYIRARLSCGTGMERLTTSALALLSPAALVEVQSLRVGEGTSVRTVRYDAVPPTEFPAGFQLAGGRELARETARVHASATMDVTDVVEAGKQLDAGAVEALLAARAAGFALSAATLRQLVAAGVPRSTIDMMVALSYPQAFRVAESTQREDRRTEWASPYYDPFRMNPYYRYDCFGLNYYSSWGCDYRYGYGYSPFGYSRYGGWYSPYGYYGGGGIVIVPVDTEGNPIEGSRGGSVGSTGYSPGGQTSRGTARPRHEPSATGTRSSASPGSSTPRASSGGSGSSSAGRGSVSGGGYTGGGSSSGGSSSGGSTSQGTAKPRGGGK